MDGLTASKRILLFLMIRFIFFFKRLCDISSLNSWCMVAVKRRIASKKRFHFLVLYFMVCCATWCWLVSVKAAYCCICCRQLTYLLRVRLVVLLVGFIVTSTGVPRTLTQGISKLFYNTNIWHDNRLQIWLLSLRVVTCWFLLIFVEK